MSHPGDIEIEREAVALGHAWGESFSHNFAQAYRQGVMLTRREGCPYPGAALVAFAVAKACADTFEEALVFTGFNAQERLAAVKRRLKAMERESDAPPEP